MLQRCSFAAIASGFLFGAANAIAVAQAAAANPPLVQVFVSATAKDGTPAALDPSVLTVSVDKAPAQVLSTRPAKDDKLLFAVMVDVSASEKPKERALEDAALQIFQQLSVGSSQGYLVLFNVETYLSKRPLLPSETQVVLDRFRFTGGTALYDSVAQVCSGILSRSNNPDSPRRILIILSDGDDNASQIAADKMEEAVQQESVPIFSLAEYSTGGSSKGLDTLMRLGRDTGGTQVLGETMAAALPKLLAAIRGQSLLSIAPTQTNGSRLHSLSIKTSEKGVSVAAPARIFIP